MNARATGFVAERDLDRPSYAELAHVPGPRPHPVPIMRTIEFLKDPLAAITNNVRTFGKVYRVHNFGSWNVVLIGPEANELVLLDRDRNFSSEHGWNPILGRVFPRGLMLMDFDRHRSDRRTLSTAFKPEAMRSYLGGLNTGITRGIAALPHGTTFAFYPAVKALTLSLAATSFLGIPLGDEADRINAAFVAMVAASIGVVRAALPGTAMGRGVRAQRFMSGFFAREIPARRGAAAGDFFTRFCNARDEAGDLLSDRAIVDHMNFLMMAAHDTLTSSLTSTVYHLAKSPEWQDRLRAEILEVRATAGADLPYDRLGELEQTEWAFKEAVRLLPPVPSIPRRALRGFDFGGFHIPAGANIGISPLYTHRMPEHWSEPERFDPERFSPEHAHGRDKYAWVPFGGGAHMCIGLHFAYLQMKSFLYALLSDYRITVADNCLGDFALFPIPKPKDGLPIRLERL